VEKRSDGLWATLAIFDFYNCEWQLTMDPRRIHRLVLKVAVLLAVATSLFVFAHCSARAEDYSSAKKKWGEHWQSLTQWYYPHTHSRGAWYNQHGKNCCTDDCFPARPGAIKWQPEGWRVIMPDSVVVTVPHEYKHLFIKPNPDEVSEDRAIACFFRSSSGALEIYKTSAWRLRCLYTGRPRI